METCERHYGGVFVYRGELVTSGVCPVCRELDYLISRVVFYQDQGKIGALKQKLEEAREELGLT